MSEEVDEEPLKMTRGGDTAATGAERFAGVPGRWVRRTALPLLLILVCPPTVILLWMITVHFNGSLTLFFTTADLDTILALVPRPTWRAARLLLFWALLQAVLLIVLPGKTHYGPVTPKGNRPRYKLNGIPAYIVTHALLFLGAYPLGLFSPTIVYDEFGSILVICNVFGLIFCVFLYLKGVYFPSTTDAGRSGNLIFDYYWGVELHPSLFGLSLKQYINCRLAMIGWSVILLSFAAKQVELYGHLSSSMLISVGLQLVYIVHFFVWEGGYFGSLDIMHDRFGFYICWGITVWLPCVYTLVGLYLVDHPIALPIPYAVFLVGVGLAAIWADGDANRQRQRVRETGGETTVWRRKPELIEAEYTTEDGETRKSLLLVSGWWGISRHVHYVAEIAAALAWTLPAMFENLLPYFYVIFLTILLVHRAGRDDRRCRKKYGRYWKQYCERVPYRIIPYVY
jgi:7-dehydrocholesterol reductase